MRFWTKQGKVVPSDASFGAESRTGSGEPQGKIESQGLGHSSSLTHPEDGAEERTARRRSTTKGAAVNGTEISKKKHFSPFRIYIQRVVKSSEFNNAILFAIFINSVLITLQMIRSTNERAATWFDVIDKILMGVYLLELSLKIYALQGRFIESPWNLFDAFIVTISIAETVLTSVLSGETNLSPAVFRLFRIFKAFKAIRAMRALQFLKSLQVIIITLYKSIPAMGSIILLLVLILYIFAIIFVDLYKDVHPAKFGNLGLAMFSLFELITMDNWTDNFYVVAAVDTTRAYGMTYLMLIFIVLETFICINLFIAVIVNNLERANMKEKQRKKRLQDEELSALLEQTGEGGAGKTKDDKKKKRGKKKRRNKKGGVDDDSAVDSKTRKKADELDAAGGDSDSGEDNAADDAFGTTGKNPSDPFIHDQTIPLWQRELQPEILAILAALDHNVNLTNDHQRMLDELVDATQPLQSIAPLSKQDVKA